MVAWVGVVSTLNKTGISTINTQIKAISTQVCADSSWRYTNFAVTDDRKTESVNTVAIHQGKPREVLTYRRSAFETHENKRGLLKKKPKNETNQENKNLSKSIAKQTTTGVFKNVMQENLTGKEARVRTEFC